MLGACILGALLLTVLMGLLILIVVEALCAADTAAVEYDDVRTRWEERQALRILHARYAAGLVSNEEYRRLAYELEKGHEP